jgi:ribosomal protein S18 acetylase RimI-like enzyme
VASGAASPGYGGADADSAAPGPAGAASWQTVRLDVDPSEPAAAATIEIGPWAEEDLPQLFTLARSAFAGVEGWSDERVFEVMTGDLVFVARESGSPAGYVALHGEPEAVMCIDQLFVAPGHEQRGVGRRLLAYAEGYAIAQRARTLRIVVEEENSPARGFYRRSGFVPVEPELFELVLPAAP